ncbi:MAG: endolytic transglycosylase MltG [Deltaproteobacteria bacterium]|nr:endolytic transglycosylase MltG [Deltaproteobacteria bacterium]
MKKVIITLLVLCIGVIVLSLARFYYYCTIPNPGAVLPVELEIPPGVSLKQAAGILKQHALLEDPFTFTLLARLKDAAHSIKSGEYRFERPTAPIDILEKLRRGEVLTYSMTITEGSTVFDIARVVEAAGFGTAKEVLQRSSDPSFIRALGMDTVSLEGYLFPDTYRFSKGTGTETVLKTMHARFRQMYDDHVKDRLLTSDFTRQELLTLASLVEKETGRQSEKPIVAAVFLNRLKKRMRLECDPTVVYGLLREDPEFRGRLRKKHLQRRTPYNTYRVSGLPPGPICNPGLESIKAVLEPAEVQYLYFVSMNNGTHKFSRTYREHNRAVYRYQK